MLWFSEGYTELSKAMLVTQKMFLHMFLALTMPPCLGYSAHHVVAI